MKDGFVRLGELIQERSIKNKENLEIPVYSVTNSKGFCTEYFSKDVSSKDKTSYKIVRLGDFAYNPSRINVGSVDWQRYQKKVIVSPIYVVFSVCENIDQQFLYYYLKSDKINFFINQLSCGSVRSNLSFTLLSKLPFPKIQKKEQQKIAQIMDRASYLIDLRISQINKLDELIKSRFMEMFGDIIANSKNWDIQPLGELCTIVRGGSPRPIEKFLGGNIPWIKIGDATKGDSIYIHSTQEHIIEAGVSKSRFIKAGSLIFANCGVSLGFARITTFDGCIHDGWLAMGDISTHLNKVFLLKSLNQITEHFRKIAPAGTQPNLNTAIMKAYKQVLPPLPLQQQFAAFVEKVDKSKLAVKQSLEKLETLKKSLMQQYFG